MNAVKTKKDSKTTDLSMKTKLKSKDLLANNSLPKFQNKKESILNASIGNKKRKIEDVQLENKKLKLVNTISRTKTKTQPVSLKILDGDLCKTDLLVKTRPKSFTLKAKKDESSKYKLLKTKRNVNCDCNLNNSIEFIPHSIIAKVANSTDSKSLKTIDRTKDVLQKKKSSFRHFSQSNSPNYSTTHGETLNVKVSKKIIHKKKKIPNYLQTLTKNNSTKFGIKKLLDVTESKKEISNSYSKLMKLLPTFKSSNKNKSYSNVLDKKHDNKSSGYESNLFLTKLPCEEQTFTKSECSTNKVEKFVLTKLCIPTQLKNGKPFSSQVPVVLSTNNFQTNFCDKDNFNNDESVKLCIPRPHGPTPILNTSMEVDAFSEINVQIPFKKSERNLLEPPLQYKNSQETRIFKDLYMVIDTNILIDYQSFLNDLNRKNVGHYLVKMVVPYIVLQELDNMKNKSENVQRKAQKAIKWVNSSLTSRDSFVLGQSIEEHLETSTDIHVQNADDAILNCCLHYKKEKKCIALLSNDINLRNKSHFSNIKAYSAEELQNAISNFDCFERDLCLPIDLKIKDIEPLRPKHPQMLDKRTVSQFPLEAMVLAELPTSSNGNLTNHKQSSKMSSLPSDKPYNKTNFSYEEDVIVFILGSILKLTLVDAYGDLWEQIVLHKPPWSALDILKCIEKHWIAVFIDKFPNEFKTIIQQLIAILSQNTLDYDKKEMMKKKLCQIMKFIKKGSYAKLLIKYKDLTEKLHDSACYPGSSASLNTISTSNEQSNSYFHSIKKTNIPTTSYKCEGQDDTFNKIQNSVIKLGEHATSLSQGLIAIMEKDNDGFLKSDENTLSSLQSLRQSLVAFGFSLKSCIEKSSSVLSVHEQISMYWTLAGEEVLQFDCSDDNIREMALTDKGRNFFMCCLTDLEKIIQTIDRALINSSTNAM